MKISITDFANLAAIRHAASRDKTETYLQGVCITQEDDELTAFASDRYIMSTRSVMCQMDRPTQERAFVDAGDLAATVTAFKARSEDDADGIHLAWASDAHENLTGIEATLVLAQPALFEDPNQADAIPPATYLIRALYTPPDDFPGWDMISEESLTKRPASAIKLDPQRLAALIKTLGADDNPNIILEAHGATQPTILHNQDGTWRGAIMPIPT